MSRLLQLAIACMVLVSMAMAIPRLSQAEEACLKRRKFYYAEKDDCFELLTKGPCADDEWFVMRNPEPGDKQTIVRGICQKNQCPGGYYWPESGECVTSKDKVNLCGNANNVTLAHNDFGEGECICKKIPVHGRINDEYNSTCYQLYRRGPCALGEIVAIPDGKLSPQCMKDSCFKESSTGKLSGKIPLGASLARFNGTCYQLGTKGPCDDDTVFQINLKHKKPLCESLLNEIKIGGCNQNFDGGCDKYYALHSVSTDFAIDSIINQVNNQANRKKRFYNSKDDPQNYKYFNYKDQSKFKGSKY